MIPLLIAELKESSHAKHFITHYLTTLCHQAIANKWIESIVSIVTEFDTIPTGIGTLLLQHLTEESNECVDMVFQYNDQSFLKEYSSKVSVTPYFYYKYQHSSLFDLRTSIELFGLNIVEPTYMTQLQQFDLADTIELWSCLTSVIDVQVYYQLFNRFIHESSNTETDDDVLPIYQLY